MAACEKYTNILNQTACYSAVSFCFSLAKETGVFASLLDAEKPLTSDEIAIENKIKERYAREMLGCLSAIDLAKVSKNEDGINVYHLEQDAKNALKVGHFSLAEMNFTRMFMSRFDPVKDCLGADKSGAVLYEPSFMELMEDTKRKGVAPLVDFLLNHVPGLRENLDKGIDAIDFGCGNAYHFAALADMFPKSDFTATDISPEFIEVAKERNSHVPNMKFDVVDLYAIPEAVSKKYDLLFTCNTIHDLPHPVEALKGIRRMIKEPSGVYAMVDFAGTGSHLKDAGSLFASYKYAISLFVCIPESYQCADSEAHGLAVGKDTMISFLTAAGFETSSVIPMKGDSALYIALPK